MKQVTKAEFSLPSCQTLFISHMYYQINNTDNNKIKFATEHEVTYGQACDITKTCRDSECIDGFCNCTTGMSYNTLSKSCVMANKMVITQACIADSDCLSHDSTYRKKTCVFKTSL